MRSLDPVRVPLPWRLAAALVVEVAYSVLTRTWMQDAFEGIERELWVSAVRGATAALYWVGFRDVIFARRPSPRTCTHPLVVTGLVCAFLSAVLAGDWDLPAGDTRVVFALTSIVVGLREELLYRGVVQNLLEPRLGWLGAIAASNVIFVLYHYGAWPFTVQNVAEFFLVGTAVGLLYRGTGSLWAAVAFHAAYDAVWCFTPFVDEPLAWQWGAAFQFGAAALLLAWAVRVVPDPAGSGGARRE